MDRLQINSLTKKIALLLAISIIVSLMVFGLFYYLSNYILNEIFENTDFRFDESEKLASIFQVYVNNNKIKADDTEEIRKWSNDNNIVYFTISRERMLIYDNAYSGNVPIDQTKSNQLHYTWIYFTPVEFADGTADVFIYKNTERKYYIFANVVVAIISLITGFIIILLGIRKEIGYIIAINAEVNKMRDGLDKASIHIIGNDEISNLASAIEKMRIALIEKEKKEIEMKSDQNKFVLGMAHDLRTPLTGLIAFIEISKRQKDLESAEMYSDKALVKANQIKRMSDQLFDFFLVSSEEKLELEAVSIESALSDYLSEFVNSLEAQGFSVNADNVSWVDKEVSVCFDYIGRIINNIQSNITKYADKDNPVILSTQYQNNSFSIVVENTISEHANDNSSNGIGEKNIRSMMQKMNGEYVSASAGKLYTMELVFYAIE